jgi:hypothetical protein
VPCSASRVVPGAHRVVGPGTHRGSGPREVHTTDGNSNKINTTSNTRLRLTTQVGQAHVATGVPPVRPVPAGETEQLSLSGSTLVRPVRHTGQTDPSLKAPKAPNKPTDHQTDQNSKQQQHKRTANTPRRSPEQKPTTGCTGQTGQEHRSDRCSLGSSG